MKEKQVPFPPLFLLISFAAVNAVLFTPALPEIAKFFAITESTAQQTMTTFLLGSTLGQLIYAPLANRFGRKPILYLGISLQIFASLLCVAAGMIYQYPLLVFGRFALALGSSVGRILTYTIIHEAYSLKNANRKLTYLSLSFAILPELSTVLGGFLVAYYGWSSCFYSYAVYGLILLFSVRKIPETQKTLDVNALKLQNLFQSYYMSLKKERLIAGALLMGATISFVYIFVTFAPFIAIDLFGMKSQYYGMAAAITTQGLILGTLLAAKLAKTHSFAFVIRLGLMLTSLGIGGMMIAIQMHLSLLFMLFLPMFIIYFGASLIFTNASTIAMSQVDDKANASAAMNFINMVVVTLVIFGLNYCPVNLWLLPIIYILITSMMIILYLFIHRNNDQLSSNIELWTDNKKHSDGS